MLRPAFQMAVDDDVLVKNPFGFQFDGVIVNDSVTRIMKWSISFSTREGGSRNSVV